MSVSKKELLQLLDAIAKVRALVVGDLILDRYIWGKVERISPEAPVPIVAVSRNEDRLGGAGNVARNLRGLGVTVELCGLIGDDLEGEELLSLLGQLDVGKDGVIVDRARPTSVKTRVIAQRQQMVRIDREISATQSGPLCEGFAAVVDAHLEDSECVLLSDYGKGVVSEPLIRTLEQAQQGGRIAANKRPLLVDPHPRNYELYRSMTVCKPNRKEAERASGIAITDLESAGRAGQALLQRWKAAIVAITLGEDGLLIVESGKEGQIHIPTAALEVFDVSGAGDTVAAVFGASLAVGASAELAGNLANMAAGIVVSEIGTAAIDSAKLRSAIERHAK